MKIRKLIITLTYFVLFLLLILVCYWVQKDSKYSNVNIRNELDSLKIRVEGVCMSQSRYSIEAHEDFVEIYGDLTIEETIDLMNFFGRKGFKSVIITQNSTIRLYKLEYKHFSTKEKE